MILFSTTPVVHFRYSTGKGPKHQVPKEDDMQNIKINPNASQADQDRARREIAAGIIKIMKPVKN